MQAAQTFLEVWKNDITPKNREHHYFLGRLQESFLQEKCGHPVITDALKQKISAIYQKHYPNSSCSASVQYKYMAFEHRADLHQLPYDPEMVNIADVIFVLNEKSAFLAHKAKFMPRNDAWKALCKSGDDVISVRADATQDAFFSLFKIIYGGKYPEKVDDLAAVQKCAESLQEREIVLRCEELILERLNTHDLEELFRLTDPQHINMSWYSQAECCYAQLVLDSDFKTVTAAMIDRLLDGATIPFTEYALFHFVWKWTQVHHKKMEVYFQKIRFEWIELDTLINEVVQKGYLDDDESLKFIKLVAHHQKNGVFPQIESWTPRPNRCCSHVNVYDVSGKDMLHKKVIAQLRLEAADLRHQKKKRVIIETPSFIAFGEKWKVKLFERYENEESYFHVLLERLDLAVFESFDVRFKQTVKGNGLQYSVKGVNNFREGCRFGALLGRKSNSGPPLEVLIEDGYLRVEFNLAVDPKKLVYKKAVQAVMSDGKSTAQTVESSKS